MADSDAPKPKLGTLCDVLSLATQAKVSFMPWRAWKVSETATAPDGLSASFTVQHAESGKTYSITVQEELTKSGDSNL